jgi:hypothetical protein
MSIENTPCTICGGETTLAEDAEQLKNNWDPFGTRQRCLAHRVCHTCSFWIEKVQLHKNLPGEFIVAAGKMFHLRTEKDGRLVDKKWWRGALGHGGADWVVVINGERIKTNNLWSNGDIPKYFRDQLPDNCELYSCYRDYDGKHHEVLVK